MTPERLNDEPLPEGFRMTELGALPAHWKVVKLGEVADRIFAGGDVPRSRFSKVQTDTFSIPIYTNGKHEAALYGYTDVATVNTPSLTISSRGTIGHSAIRLPPFYPAVRLLVVIPNSKLIYLYYLKYAIDQTDFSKHFEKSPIPQLTVPMVINLNIPLPPLAEQRAIAHALRTVQEARDAAAGVAAALRELKRSLMRHLFAYGPIPPETANRLPLQDTELGALPAHWKVVKLGEVVIFERGVSWSKSDESKTGIGVLGIPNIEDTGQVSLKPRTFIAKHVPSKKLLSKGDVILVGSSGSIQNVGRLGVIKETGPEPLTFASFTVRARPCESHLEKSYLPFLLKSSWIDFSKLSKRAADGKYNLQVQQLRNHPIPLPPLEEQQEIARILQAVDDKIAAEESRRQALEALFQSLLHHLMTGKVRVPPTLEAPHASCE